MESNDWQKAEKVLKSGGVIVAPTDTLYGILAKAESKKGVDKVYKIKGRDKHKPCIVLITSLSDFKKFNISLSDDQKVFLNRVWPGKVSVILPCIHKKLQYLHRDTKTIAFRMIGPRNRNLFHLIKDVGPLVAPSANIQGAKPASTIWEAKKYFGNNVDLYMCGGTRKSKPSALVEYKNGKLVVLRKGAVEIKKG